jgi:hypothetical protein
LVSGEVHRLRHTEDLGIVESGLVEILKSLGDEEEREKEPIDAAKNCFVLLGSLKAIRKSATTFSTSRVVRSSHSRSQLLVATCGIQRHRRCRPHLLP